MRMCREILDVIEVWCRNLGLMLESEYRGDRQMLTLVFKRNSRDEAPFTMKFDLGAPCATKEYIIERIKKDVKRRYDVKDGNEFFNFDAARAYPYGFYAEYAKLYREKRRIPTIKDVIFNGPATIVIWADDTKTVVKCQEGDTLDPEKGLAMAIAKKALGNKGNFNDEFKKWLPE